MRNLIHSLCQRLTGRRDVPQLLSAAELQPFALSPAEQRARIRQHLHSAGKTWPRDRKPRVFLAVGQVNWEQAGLVDSWAGLAETAHCDLRAGFDQYAPDWADAGKPALNRALLEQAAGYDLFFAYLSGRLAYPETIRAIGARGCVTVNIGFDDTYLFWGRREGGVLAGNAEIAPAFDICLTCQAAADARKYAAVGANPLFLPPGANPAVFSVPSVERDIPVAFIGQCYGERPKRIARLRAAGIPVQTFGKGWPSGPLSAEAMRAVYARTLINLGFGYISRSDRQTGLKGRDFEVPLTGGLYLTTYNPDLAQCFAVGAEIDCYRDERELIAKLRHYLAHPEDARRIGASGRARALADHTWARRWQTLFAVIGGDAEPAP